MNEIKRDTTKDLFFAVLNLVKENGHYDKAAAIMHYHLPNENENNVADDIELSAYGFDFIATVTTGGGEGIFADCFIIGKYSETEIKNCNYNTWTMEVETKRHIGTFKTLRKDLDAYKVMGELCGALAFYASQYINANIDRYTPARELERQKQRKSIGADDPCPDCAMEGDCLNDYTDVRHMCGAYARHMESPNTEGGSEKNMKGGAGDA